MALDLHDCHFHGPALPEPFVKFELEKELAKRKLLVKTTGDEGRAFQAQWDLLRRTLQGLAASGGPLRVFNHVIEPLMPLLGYSQSEDAPRVQTREDQEAGGTWLVSDDGAARLRVWTTAFNEDLYAPARRGRAYRFSHLRIAQRVLLTTGERVGLLTNGVQLLLCMSDPARPDSTVTIPLDPSWKRQRTVPDSLRLVIALVRPEGVQAFPDLVDMARLQQVRVTRELRVQARQAVERFLQEMLDHPENREWFAAHPDRDALAKALWHEGLITVYRLLFIFKLEASDDVARSFTFASTSLWRNTFSPSMALARYARDVLAHGVETGTLLEGGLRTLFKMFDAGMECTELHVKPLGGALFGGHMTPILTQRVWGERAVAHLLDRLLWTPQRRGADTRERVHYGPLDVEDLGRVYEALLELEPGISSEPMCRLRRQKLEVVVPLAQGERYHPAQSLAVEELSDTDDTETEEADSEDEETPTRGKKTTVEWIEEIPPHRFYLRVGLGRKASGSYYTPHTFVRFLVQETLGPQVAERSPQDDPQPLAILTLKVLDPAMGSGHFLVEACRFLGEKLYEACRLCDDKALAAERRADRANKAERQTALTEAQQWRQRIIDLPDPDDELLTYLPSHSPEGEETGYSQQRAEALCRRLVAVHCLYGVDKNPLAVELAKLALWLESHAEGRPLTFLDHRLVVGDSLTGPFWERLIFRPGNPQEPVQNLFHQDLSLQFQNALHDAIRYIARLEASVGITVAEMQEKETVKAQLDRALLPFRIAAAAWSGGVMLGPEQCDDIAYAELLQVIAHTGDLPERIESERLVKMIARGLGMLAAPVERDMLYATANSVSSVPSLPYDLTFPEIYYSTSMPHGRKGFHVVLGNPPWDAIQSKSKEFFASFDFEIMDAPTKRERSETERRLLANPAIATLFRAYTESFEEQKRLNDVLYRYQKVQVEGDLAGRQLDYFRVFMERNSQLLDQNGMTGVLVPSAFHANEGATGIRHLYLEEMALRCCYSFENRRKLFEIDSRFKFALVVASRTGPTVEFPCAFYLHDDEWLFGDHQGRKLHYALDFIRHSGGAYLAFVEPRDNLALTVLSQLLLREKGFADLLINWHITPNTSELPMLAGDVFISLKNLDLSGKDPREPHTTKILNARGYAPLHEGKTFSQFDDQFGEAIRYAVRMSGLADRPRWLSLWRYYRLAYRAISASTNERTGIAVLLPPGTVSTRKAASDITPFDHPLWQSLWFIALFNSFPLDSALRSMVQTDVSLFIVKRLSAPPFNRYHDQFLAHSALRLTCNHAGYESLWREQLGDIWCEPKPSFIWPVLEGGDARWQLRAAIDAVVADAYGLTRQQYAHILSTFNHRSYPNAPTLCLARFDELLAIGLEAFTHAYDPYWDIPLNEHLPQPVIDLPVLTSASDNGDGESHRIRTPEQTQRRTKRSRNQLSMEL